MIDLTENFYNAMEQYDRKHSEEHKHSKGRSGASGLGKGPLLASIYRAQCYNIPKLTGIKAYKGGLWVGSWEHEKVQEILLEHFKNSEFKDEMFAEVYIAVPLTNLSEEQIIEELERKNYPVQEFLAEKKRVINGEIDKYFEIKEIKNINVLDDYLIEIPRTFEDLCLEHSDWLNEIGIETIISPIDFAHISGHGIVYKQLKFRNIEILAPFKHPDSKFKEIWDIKTASDYGFYKMFQGNFSEGYMIQFMIYMRATGLKSLKVFAVRKDNLLNFEYTINWDQKIWDLAIKKKKRVNQLVRELYHEDLKKIPSDFFEQNDLSCVYDPQGIGWYSCPLSHTHEEIDDRGKTRLIFDAPCRFAQYHINKLVPEIFKVGTTWKRGKATVSVVDLDAEQGLLKSMNRSKREYIDPFNYVYKNYK